MRHYFCSDAGTNARSNAGTDTSINACVDACLNACNNTRSSACSETSYDQPVRHSRCTGAVAVNTARAWSITSTYAAMCQQTR